MRTILIALLITLATQASAKEDYEAYGFKSWICYTGFGSEYIFLNFEEKLIAKGKKNAWRWPQKLLAYDVNYDGSPKSVVWRITYEADLDGQTWGYRYFSLAELIYRTIEVIFEVDNPSEPLRVFEFDELKKNQQKCKLSR